MNPNLLIVDDEKPTRDGLRAALEDRYEVYVAEDAASAANLLEAESFEVLLTDFRLPNNEDGMKLIARAKSLAKPPICILMTAYGSEELAVEALKQGADDYLAKGRMQIDELETRIARALKLRTLESENKTLKQQLNKKFGLENIIGESEPMQKVMDTVRQVAPSRATVLIQGESGTGKELLAKAIHQLSPRSRRPMVTVHCAALSPTLLESELFGHEKGAFTGAHERRVGVELIRHLDAALQRLRLRRRHDDQAPASARLSRLTSKQHRTPISASRARLALAPRLAARSARRQTRAERRTLDPSPAAPRQQSPRGSPRLASVEVAAGDESEKGGGSRAL